MNHLYTSDKITRVQDFSSSIPGVMGHVSPHEVSSPALKPEQGLITLSISKHTLSKSANKITISVLWDKKIKLTL